MSKKLLSKLVSGLLFVSLTLTGCSNFNSKVSKSSNKSQKQTVSQMEDIKSSLKNIGKIPSNKLDSSKKTDNTASQAAQASQKKASDTRSSKPETNSSSAIQKSVVSTPAAKTSPVPQLIKPSTQALDRIQPESVSAYDTLKNQIEQNLANRNLEFTLTYACNYTQTFDIVDKIVSELEISNPYDIYNVIDYSEAAKYIDDNSTSITLKMTYRTTAEQERIVTNTINSILSDIINPSMTTIQKELAIHDWIVNNTQYDQSLTIFDAYNTLIQHTGTCEGYALLAYKMFSMAGINNMAIVGTAYNVGHMWNLVNINGSYYHVDCTFDDPVSSNGRQYLMHNYFNITDSQIGSNHSWDKSLYPASSTIIINNR